MSKRICPYFFGGGCEIYIENQECSGKCVHFNSETMHRVTPLSINPDIQRGLFEYAKDPSKLTCPNSHFGYFDECQLDKINKCTKDPLYCWLKYFKER